MSGLLLLAVSLALPPATAARPPTRQTPPAETAAPQPLPPDEALLDEADKLQAEGKFAAAIPIVERAIALRETALGPDALPVAEAVNQLGILSLQRGAFESADAAFGRVLGIRERALGADDPLVAQAINNLGQVAQQRGDLVAAEPLLKRALDTYERAYGGEHAAVATACNNLAGLYVLRGDYERAEPLHLRALALREKLLGPETPQTAQSVNNLALLYADRGEVERAEPLFRRSLEIREKTLNPNHPDVGRAVLNLAVNLQEQGRLADAEPLYRRALEISERSLGPDHPTTGVVVNGLAVVCLLTGRLGEARALYERAVKVRERALGPQHPDMARAIGTYAVYFEVTGDTAEMVRYQSRAADIVDRNLDLVLGAGSEQQKLRYVETFVDNTNITLSYHLRSAPSSEAAATLAFETALRRKGRVLDATSGSLDALRRRLSPEDRALLEKLAATRARLAGLVLRGPAGGDVDTHQAQIAALEREAQQIESDVSARSRDVGARSGTVDIDTVRAKIPPHAALVEFVRYLPFDSHATRRDRRFGAARYAAYVLPASGALRWVDLGDAATIDRAIGEFRRQLVERSRDVNTGARALDRLVMQPVRPLVGAATHLLLAPDGALNLVPFAALRDTRARWLIERYAFTYLTSGRDLLRAPASPTIATAPLIVADPRFDTAPAADNDGVAAASGDGAALRAVDLSRATFAPLPATAAEAEGIRHVLPDAVVLTGIAATEQAVKAVKGPRILHLATHGFFLSADDSAPRPGPTDGRLLVMTQPGASPLASNPLLRSGLAFAGANQRQSAGGEDGVLLGIEAAGLNLDGTAMVVLSACETGLGDVSSGEGVFGLRRALVLAGADSQIITLWPVSDRATRDLMVAYYTRLFRDHAGRTDGLRAVQRDMLKDPARRHPFYWASFIQSGAWGPL